MITDADAITPALEDIIGGPLVVADARTIAAGRIAAILVADLGPGAAIHVATVAAR